MKKLQKLTFHLRSLPFIKIEAFIALYLLSALPLFAQQNAITQMETFSETILDLFTQPFVKAILAIFLCGSAIAYAFNKDNDKIKRNAIAIGIAAIILMSATGLVGLLWTKS